MNSLHLYLKTAIPCTYYLSYFCIVIIATTSMKQKPSLAFIATSWAALLIGASGYIIGLWNAEMLLNEKGYYFTILMYGLFAGVSVQKCVRDRQENIVVTDLYYGISWISTILCIILLTVGLWNATLLSSEKGFYAFAFLLSIFGAISVQKNTRDAQSAKMSIITEDTTNER